MIEAPAIPSKNSVAEHAAWREMVNGITLERLRHMFEYDESDPAIPLKRRKVASGPKPAGGAKDSRRSISIGGAKYKVSRLVWIIHHGPIPPEYVIDHISRDHNDNRISNLRLVTNSENQRNKEGFGKSTYRGVAWRERGGDWQSKLRVNGQQVFIGTYDTEIEAAAAFDAAQRLYFGPGHPHPSNVSEGLISQDTVDQLPIGELVPIRKSLGVTAGQWRKAKQAADE